MHRAYQFTGSDSDGEMKLSNALHHKTEILFISSELIKSIFTQKVQRSINFVCLVMCLFNQMVVG